MVKLRLMFLKDFDPRGGGGGRLSTPAMGLYTCTCPLFSNIFSETAGPIKAKFHVEPPREGGKKVYLNGPGHMTRMAAMPIYGKNL